MFTKTVFIYTIISELFVVEGVLFCAANKNSATSSQKNLIFDEVMIQRGQGYDMSTGYFNPPMSGIYFFHLSSGLMPHTGINIEMRTSSSVLITRLYQTSTIHNGYDMTSVAFIGTLTKDSPIYLYINTGATTSDSLRQTSWSAFLLDNLVDPLIAFCVHPPAGLITAKNSTLEFSVTTFNIGNAWNNATNTFTAPRAGVYIFRVSFSVTATNSNGVKIIVKNTLYQRIFLFCTNHNGNMMTEKTFALLLSVGDTIYLDAYYANNSLYSDNYVTSFAGFLYEPLNSHKVIWSVHRNNSILGKYSPFPFDGVSVNIGGGWNQTINIFVVPYAGVYQLHLTATSYGYYAVDYRLMWNGVAYASIFSNTTNYSKFNTISRSVMIEASVGDTFYIANTYASALYSVCGETSFTGYLIVE